jgi:integrase
VCGQTVVSYAKRWIEGRNVKGSTKSLYRDVLKNHIAPTSGTGPAVSLGDIAIGALSVQIVADWYAKLPADKPRVKAQSYSLLHAICATAVEQELISRNPCAIKRAMSSNRKREPVLLSVGELERVADTIRPQRYKTLVLLSAWCALRFGEATELRRRDVDENYETITVLRGVTHRKPDATNNTRCHIDTPKSGKGRTIPVPPHCRADLKHHLDTFVPNDQNALLFPAPRSACHLLQNVFREIFKTACISVGRDNVTIHDLRHFGATMTSRAGASAFDVKARLGHSTLKAAMEYQHSELERQREIAEAMSALAESIRGSQTPPAL